MGILIEVLQFFNDYDVNGDQNGNPNNNNNNNNNQGDNHCDNNNDLTKQESDNTNTTNTKNYIEDDKDNK